MDRISLTGIEVYAYGGVTDAERAVGQRYRVDVDLTLDLTAAGRSDAIENTVSYFEVYEEVMKTLRGRPFKLLESAALRVAERLLWKHPVERVTVRLAKLLPPIDGIIESAAVHITRERADIGDMPAAVD